MCVAVGQLLPDLNGVEIREVEDDDSELIIVARVRGREAGCPGAVGQPVRAFVQLRCRHGACLLRTTAEADLPEVAAIHRLSGEYCTLLELRARDLRHFGAWSSGSARTAELRTHVVLSTQYEGRPVAPLDTPRPVTPSAGWGPRGDEG